MYYSAKYIDFLYVWGLIGNIRIVVCISNFCLRCSQLADEVIKLGNSDVGSSQLVVPEKIRLIKVEDLVYAMAVGKPIKRSKKVLL